MGTSSCQSRGHGSSPSERSLGPRTHAEAACHALLMRGVSISPPTKVAIGLLSLLVVFACAERF
jgi:hypothetical protein